MSETVMVKGGSTRLVPKSDLKSRAAAGWSPASELPSLDQELLRKRFAADKKWSKALKPLLPLRKTAPTEKD